MYDQDHHLSEMQKRFLSTFLTHVGEQAVDREFKLVWLENRRFLRYEQVEIPVNIPDSDLIMLAGLGYLRIYSDDSIVVFTKKVLEQSTDQVKDEQSAPDERLLSLSLQVLETDLFQVRVWLAASVAASLFCLLLLWMTVQQALKQHIAAGSLSAVLTAVSAFVTAIFYRNYYKANGNLERLRSILLDLKNRAEVSN